MRVIGGIFKGRRLTCPTGQTIRPVPDRLKESLFSIIQPWIETARVLDLCSGTGAMGIEAMSRGADTAVFVDRWDVAIGTLRGNLAACGLSSGVEVLPKDVGVALDDLADRGDRFDLIFFDPPYASTLYHPTMLRLGVADLLTPEALVMVMHHAKNPLAQTYGKLRQQRLLRQGENLLTFFGLD